MTEEKYKEILMSLIVRCENAKKSRCMKTMRARMRDIERLKEEYNRTKNNSHED